MYREHDEAFEVVRRAWSIMLCKSALEALIKYGAPKSEYEALIAGIKENNESNSRRVKKHK